MLPDPLIMEFGPARVIETWRKSVGVGFDYLGLLRFMNPHKLGFNYHGRIANHHLTLKREEFDNYLA